MGLEEEEKAAWDTYGEEKSKHRLARAHAMEKGWFSSKMRWLKVYYSVTSTLSCDLAKRMKGTCQQHAHRPQRTIYERL